MTTEQIVWTVVVVAAALALMGVIVSSMRRRTQQDNRVRAAEIREQADTRSAVIPEAEARAEAEEARAEQVRLEAERAEERAREARGAVAQEEALHEDRIRAADRLDPDVDHKAKDYTPGTHAAERTEPETADTHDSGPVTGTHAGERPAPAVQAAPTEPPAVQAAPTEPATDPHPGSRTEAGASTGDPETIFDSRDSDAPAPAGRRINPDAAPEPDWTDPDQRDGTAGGTTGGSHRA